MRADIAMAFLPLIKAGCMRLTSDQVMLAQQPRDMRGPSAAPDQRGRAERHG